MTKNERKRIENFLYFINTFNPSDPKQAEYILESWGQFNPPYGLEPKLSWKLLHPFKWMENNHYIKLRNEIMENPDFNVVLEAKDTLYGDII